MSYAKPCKYCKTTQVIWDDKLSGPNKFKELETNQPHTRDRCNAAKSGGQQSMQPTTATYKYEEPMQEQGIYGPMKQEQPQHDDFKLAQLITKVDNLNIAIAKVMSMLQTKQDLTVDPDDVRRLRIENEELKQIEAQREDNFVPANKVPQQSEAEHVRAMVEKGKQAEEDEELDLT